jgi:hypothetical protein
MLDKFKLKNVKFALFPKSKLQGVDGKKSANSSLSDLSKKFSDFFSSKISKINATTEEIVGIDISHEAIHVAQTSKKNDENWILDKFSYRFLDQTKLKENLLDTPDYLVSEITLALANANITTKNVVEKETVPETNKVVEEQFIKKAEVKKKEPFVFKTERSRVDYSRHVYWCNPFEPINKGKLGTTQGWRIEKPVKQYY